MRFAQIQVWPELRYFDAAAPRIVEPTRVSTGRGRTTCAWFTPDGGRLLFASSHLDPQLRETETAAIKQAEEDARTGRRRRYQWDFDPHMDLFVADLERSGPLAQLTNAPGYDAECSFSPDGRQLLFVSDRDGDPDIYAAEADGKNIRQLLDECGARPEHLTKLVVYLTDVRHRETVYRVMGEYIRGVHPVCTGLVVVALARPEWLVEIDATAVIPD